MSNSIDSEIIYKLFNAMEGRSVLGVKQHIYLADFLSKFLDLTKAEKVGFLDPNFLFRKDVLNIPVTEINVKYPPLFIDKTKKHRLVLGVFNFGAYADASQMKQIAKIGLDRQEEKLPLIAHPSTSGILHSVDLIEDGGFGIFLIGTYRRSFVFDKIREHLEVKGFFVNALLELPSPFLGPHGSLREFPRSDYIMSDVAVIVSRYKTEKIFALCADDINLFPPIFEHAFIKKNVGGNLVFADSIDKDLYKGIWVKPEDFEGFRIYRLKQDLASLEGDYASFADLSLSDFCMEINRLSFDEIESGFNDLENVVYVPIRDGREVVKSKDKMEIAGHNYLQLVVDKNKMLNTYLSLFLNSEYGKRLLEIERNKYGHLSPCLTTATIKNLLIKVPSLEVQSKIITIFEKVDELRSKTNKLILNLTKNPITDDSSLESLDRVLCDVEELNVFDKIRTMIKGGENKTTEFKQTITYDINRETKESKETRVITISWIKNVAAFLNSEGGDLLIGVKDDREIFGLNFEMDKYFNKKGEHEDNLKKHVKNVLKDYIGEQFYPLIDTQLVLMDGLYVLWINCKPSDREVFVRDVDFYVRTNPATDKLQGREQTEYIKRRFNYS